MRKVVASDGKEIKLTQKLRSKLRQILPEKHDRALGSRTYIESTWRTCLRMYQGTPVEQRWVPFSNAPRIEITIGAENADAICAQAEDLIFQAKPPLTARSRKDSFDPHAEAMQKLIDYGVESGKWNVRSSTKTFILDDVQLGTGIFYVPWTNTIRKTDLNLITNFGPQIQVIAPENFILPSNAPSDLQQAEFCTIRVMMSKEEAILAGSIQGWELDDENSTVAESDVTKDRRNLAGITNESGNQKQLAIAYTWGCFDIDGDGVGEDIYVIWNMTSRNPLKAMWNQYDCRPFVKGVYQERAHVPWGIGVLEMDANYEEEATEIRNNRVWNMMMRNQIMFSGPEVAMPEVKELYNGKYIPNDNGVITVIPMGEADRTPIQAEMISISNAKQRVGVNELNATSRLGGRTPGITALSALQQANRRFTPAFDNMRNAVAGAVMHCLYRIQERVRAGDKDVISQLNDILEEKDAKLVLELFRKKDVELTDALDIELTAASVSVNREADRQNMIMLWGVVEKYMQIMAMLAQAKAQPPFHGAEIEADKAAEVVNRIMRKILRTFDQIADVDGYLITLDDINAGTVMPPAMAEMMGGMQNAPQNGAPPQGPPQQ